MTEEALQTREKQLDITLPPSYREFLLISNGFGEISPFLDQLHSLNKIEFPKSNEDRWWLDLLEEYRYEVSDEEYFVYGDKQRTELYRCEYLKNSLKISEWCDGLCVFLNPIIKHGEEWEVLEYATWYPGIARYRSFKDFLIKTHESNLDILSDRNEAKTKSES